MHCDVLRGTEISFHRNGNPIRFHITGKRLYKSSARLNTISWIRLECEAVNLIRLTGGGGGGRE